MPTTVIETPATPYMQVPGTSGRLDWADLRTLDLVKYDLPGENQELARPPLPNEEKQKYRAALEQGNYNRWKPASIRNLIPGVKNNFEDYNLPKFIPEHAGRPHPEIVRAHWHSIERFSRHVHNHNVKKLLVIFAVALGLEDEEWLVKRHRYDQTSGDHLRYMKYYVRSEENSKLGGVWRKEHSDMGSLTLFFCEPVAALQVLTKSGVWKYVRPQMEALSVNIADALQFMTSSIHRVVAPPKDQAHIDRLGVLYMVRIEDDCDLVPIDESPVPQKHGLTGNKVLGSDGQPLKLGNGSSSGSSRTRESPQRKRVPNEVNDVEALKGVKVHYFD
ncbi:hypothetical protein BDW60DRAFT_222888 [Aspergillus nidulans var. acristatus]